MSCRLVQFCCRQVVVVVCQSVVVFSALLLNLLCVLIVGLRHLLFSFVDKYIYGLFSYLLPLSIISLPDVSENKLFRNDDDGF